MRANEQSNVLHDTEKGDTRVEEIGTMNLRESHSKSDRELAPMTVPPLESEASGK